MPRRSSTAHRPSTIERDAPDDPACVLAINAGSSSVRFALYDLADKPVRRFRGKLARIGLPDATLEVEYESGGPLQVVAIQAGDHAAAATALIDWLEEARVLPGLKAIGHRIVHGGPRYSAPVLVDADLLEALRGLSAYSPEHLPAQIDLIERVGRRMSGIPQVACFDTDFHRDMPRVAKLLPIPRRFYEKGVRRFGFHGLSYAFLMDELDRVAGTDAARGPIILAHLGNGSSLAAVSQGKPIDTSMAFTPAAGVPMGTRSGDLDPGLAWYLARTEGMSAEQFHHMVNHESGLLGISETGSDMRDLLARETTDERAAEAVALYCYQVMKSIGAYAAALGGLDTLVFSGGIGENAPAIRRRICERLGFAGVVIDDGRNDANEGVISADTGRVTVRVIPTDEEAMIARATRNFLASEDPIAR